MQVAETVVCKPEIVASPGTSLSTIPSTTRSTSRSVRSVRNARGGLRSKRKIYRRHSIKEYEAAIRYSRGIVTVAAERLGVCSYTMYRQLHKTPALYDLMMSVIREEVDKTENVLLAARDRGEAWAVIYHLKMYSRYREMPDAIGNRKVDASYEARIAEIRKARVEAVKVAIGAGEEMGHISDPKEVLSLAEASEVKRMGEE